MAQIFVRICAEPFDPLSLIAERQKTTTSMCGALVSFTGFCRDENGRLKGLEIQHYAAMAHKQITAIAEQAARRWPVTSIDVHHRHGQVAVGEPIVLVITTSSHRKEAFAACEYIMDYLKTSAPFWKREILIAGERGDWVQPSPGDSSQEGR